MKNTSNVTHIIVFMVLRNLLPLKHIKHYNLNILNLNKDSEIFLLQEVQDEKIELLFGDGFFGKKLETGDQIIVRYITFLPWKRTDVLAAIAVKDAEVLLNCGRA